MALDTSKIIHAPVGGGRYTVTSPIVKEDYGLYLLIEGLELPSTYEVDFSNSEHNGTSVTMIGNADGVLIPSQFISSGKDVFAFLYHVGVDFGRTVYKFRIPNKLRPDRTDEQPTPEQQSVIEQAISALNDAVAKTAQDVIDADASAQSASQSAENAHDSAVDAQNYAESAQTSANNASASASQASASATASANSASQSAQIKTDVQGLVSDAQGYASASAQSATASANSASQALSSAQSASASASSAQGYASQAQTSAQTASTKASEASASASTASTKATEASQSASQALTYKTDAESAKTESQTAQGLAESARDSAISAKDDAEDARDEAQSIVDGISGKTEQIDSNTERIESLEDDIFKPYAVDSASGSIASFSDGADDIPLKSLVVNIDPVQDLSHGDPSPENLCPISGWSKVNVETSGKNIANAKYGSKIPSIISGQMVNGNGWSTEYIKVDNSKTYRVSVGNNSTSYLLYYDYNLAFLGGRQFSRVIRVDAESYFSGASYIKLRNDAAENNNPNIQLELGTTYTAYEPYSGQSITIQLGQTVYGGKLDVLGGVLTVDMANIASYNGETLPSTWISDRDVYASGTTPTTGAQVVYQLATPLEIQLTPHEVNSLLGQNNIFADTGDVSVEYRADTKLYIEKLTQPEEDDMIADSAITSGQFFMIGNSLYRALANIASGATITVGTNAQRVSLADALNLVNA